MSALRRTILLVVVTVAVIGLLASGAIWLSTRSSSSHTPPGPASYGTVEQLRQAAVNAGYVCPHWHQDNVVKLAAESGACSDNDVFTTYASTGDLQAQLDSDKAVAQVELQANVDPGVALVGPNWMVRGADGPIRALQRSIGGTVVVPAG